MNDMISIIVPIFNAEQYLVECIDSLLQQSYKNIEILLIDDGSKDSSGLICDSYLYDERVKVYHNKNHGVGYTRNFGINKAKGEYILFVDSDDICDIDLVYKLYSNIYNNKADFALCGLYICNNSDYSYIKFDKYEVLNIVEYLENILSKIKIGQLCGAPYCKMFKSQIIKANNLKFIEGISYAEDFDFNMDYLLFVKKIVLIEDCLYKYRLNASNSLTQNNYRNFSKEKYWEQRLIAYKKFEKVFTYYNVLGKYEYYVYALLSEFVISSIKMTCKFHGNIEDILNHISSLINNDYVQNRVNYKYLKYSDKIRIWLIKRKRVKALYNLESFRYYVGRMLKKI